MDLPVMPPLKPMLAKAVSDIPDLGHTEPKWDGFRTIVFRDGDEIVLGSRNERPMTRYFPEVIEALKDNLPSRCVVDGELVVIADDRLDFDALQQRIHPADSRVRKLAEQTPASFVAFDLIAEESTDLMRTPFEERRVRLESMLANRQPPIFLTPSTSSLDTAREWFARFEGAGLDGVVAKPRDGTYQPDKRTMFKVKHERTADCVVAGYRLHKSSTPDRPLLGSLLLGLYANGILQHVGVAASFTAARRAQLVEQLRPLEAGTERHPWTGGAVTSNPDRLPGAQSRWSQGKDPSFIAIRPELVVEVAYDQMQGARFRHTAQFRRWRPDRDPTSCSYDQLEQPVGFRLADILEGGICRAQPSTRRGF
ncbi:ATP-dependent DNA ligase [uncultured Microbacterium sp.]|uniref:ATP-dependent DNA ligase n=1 Tax=uncultured Microbacterium sp. TaxID=191216 RepID=UPI002602C763|nr:ATP-dependent DNA ligase [uncultured Microbacterium sp.]